jgi:glycine C-acetyltransferase
MTNPLERRIEPDLEQFIKDGTYKRLNFLDSPQGPRVNMEGRGEVIILSSNNYLGLSNEPAVVRAGKQALDRFGCKRLASTGRRRDAPCSASSR